MTYKYFGSRTPSSAARKAASVSEPTFRVRCNVCLAPFFFLQHPSPASHPLEHSHPFDNSHTP